MRQYHEDKNTAKAYFGISPNSFLHIRKHVNQVKLLQFSFKFRDKPQQTQLKNHKVLEPS